jgi:speckle-type POZ protein
MESISPCNPLAIDCGDELITHLEKLIGETQFSDVEFYVGGREFPAHKNILASRSKFFVAMFENLSKEKLTDQIEIECVKLEVFHQLLRFIYTGRLTATTIEAMAADLYIAAIKYQLDELKKKCETEII